MTVFLYILKVCILSLIFMGFVGIFLSCVRECLEEKSRRYVSELLTLDEFKRKYPEYRDEMSEEREREYVNDLFAIYEKEGFSKVFWAQGGEFPDSVGKPFKVLGRTEVCDADHPDGVDLEDLPMWNIRFNDGTQLAAYPDEIIPSQMKGAGCPARYMK